jgi:hypothetical protein
VSVRLNLGPSAPGLREMPPDHCSTTSTGKRLAAFREHVAAETLLAGAVERVVASLLGNLAWHVEPAAVRLMPAGSPCTGVGGGLRLGLLETVDPLIRSWDQERRWSDAAGAAAASHPPWNAAGAFLMLGE